MNHKLKTGLRVLVTPLIVGIVGFGCYHTGVVESRIKSSLMYEDLNALQENISLEGLQFSEENLLLIFKKLNVKFPEIVLAQSKLETGHYSSKIYFENNNLFGMKKAYRRPSTCKGTKYGHCYYDDWFDSVIDYVIYQRVFLSHIENSDDYLRVLGKSYAEDPRYAEKLKKLINSD
jgi:hypothetical protein